MDFQALRILIEASQAGSLAEAGRRLRLSPMAVSRALAALEDELGVRLMHRTTRSLALTEEGSAFLPHAEALLEEEAAAYASVRAGEAEPAGLLRVSASAAFGRKVVAPFAAGFLRAHPKVRLDLLLTDSMVDIVAEGIDLAVRIARLTDSALVGRRLADSPRLLCAAPAYLRARGTPATLKDLRDHDCIASTGVTHWNFLDHGRLVKILVAGRFSSNSVEGIHEACVGGLGIANLSAWEVKEELAAGRLVLVRLEDGVPEPFDIWAVYPTRRMVPPKVRAFVAALHAHLATTNGK